MKIKIISIFFVLLASIGLQAQNEKKEPPKAVLEESDISKYAESIYPLAVEFNKLDMGMKGKEGNPADQWAANAEGRAILAKYGWDEETFPLKFAAITWGYTYLMMKKEVDKLPDDQKEQAYAMMPLFDTYKNLVHEDDLSLIKKHQDELEPAFKKLEKL